MLIAVDAGGALVEPTPGCEAYCPGCHQRLIPRCGQIKVWHFAHRGVGDCDSWAEAENEWTASWKRIVGPDRRDRWLNGHRADMLMPRGFPVILRYSGTSADEIEEREAHFGEMVWIFDVRRAYDDERLILREKRGEGGTYFTFRWKHARVSLAYARQDVVLDVGATGVLFLKKIYPEAPVGGWGYFLSREEVVRQLLLPPPVPRPSRE